MASVKYPRSSPCTFLYRFQRKQGGLECPYVCAVSIPGRWPFASSQIIHLKTCSVGVKNPPNRSDGFFVCRHQLLASREQFAERVARVIGVVKKSVMRRADVGDHCSDVTTSPGCREGALVYPADKCSACPMSEPVASNGGKISIEY